MHAAAVKVGFASTTFEDLGVLHVSGKGDAARQEVHDPLHVRVVAFVGDAPEARGAIVTGDVMDWCESRAPCRLVRRQIADQHGIAPENVTFQATHTHAAAYPRSAAQKAAFAKRVCGAVGEAVASARAVEVGYRQVDLGGGAIFNRRVMVDPRYGAACLMFNPGLTFRDDGTVEATAQIRQTVETEWGGQWADCGASRRAETMADGPTDTFMHVLLFRAGGKVIGGLVRMSGHAVIVSTYWFPNTVSADYPGAMCRHLRAALGAEIAFCQGLSGDSRPLVPDNTFAACEAYGERLADAALAAASEMEFAPLESVRIDRRGLHLPAHPDTKPTPDAARAASAEVGARAEANKARGGPGWQTKRLLEEAFFHKMTGVFYEDGFIRPGRLDEGVGVELAVWRIGPAVLVSLPGELFSRWGHQVIASVHPRLRGRVILCNSSTDSREYIPPREDMLLGGYEAVSSAVAPGAAEALARHAIEMINAV